MAVNSTSNCGSGLVTASCPFTLGLGLNDLFEGDAIVTMTNNANGYFYDSSSSGVIESSSGDGSLWVQVNPFSGGHAGLVNVVASDNFNHNGEDCVAAASGTAGDPVAIFCFVATTSFPATSPLAWNETSQ